MTYSPPLQHVLIQGDAAAALARQFPASSIDMVYSDPPFGNQLEWTGKAGRFSDRWSETDGDAGWAALDRHNPAGRAMMVSVAPDRSARGYLGFMAGLLVELRRVLKLTGTLWLHFDDTMGAYLRLLGQVVFGPASEVGTLVWKRTAGGHANSNCFGRVHDTIACYARSRVALWRLWRIGTIGGDPCRREFNRFDGFALAAPLSTTSKERVGYPTQKPVALLKELIQAATLPGDTVLDPTCGSGTCLVAARSLGRRSIGIDRSADAIRAATLRLERVPA